MWFVTSKYSLVGKQQANTAPFKVADLKNELSARGIPTADQKKPELQRMLNDELRGIQSVPAFLLLDPEQNLTELHLEQYTILDSEPLHDLKGHLANLLEELPNILPDKQKEQVEQLCAAKLGVKVSGAAMRATVICVLKNENAQDRILQLLKTIITVSKILYLDEVKRTPKQVLSLYNHAWLHMELCKDLFHSPKKLSRRKLFGTYLHALTSHAPIQYELVCQKSINSENQE